MVGWAVVVEVLVVARPVGGVEVVVGSHCCTSCGCGYGCGWVVAGAGDAGGGGGGVVADSGGVEEVVGGCGDGSWEDLGRPGRVDSQGLLRFRWCRPPLEACRMRTPPGSDGRSDPCGLPCWRANRVGSPPQARPAGRRSTQRV